MCGIMGIVGPRPARDWTAWGQLTRHRGPDAFGIWHDEHALLAHNRLAIIDLSAAADQPMRSADGRHVIVFNGEIFNFLELRDELERAGAVFATHSDTEVILEGYRRWGPDVLDRLDGMFAFVIWDCERRRAFGARDHVGIKPLFYRRTQGKLIFGSELKVLTALADTAPCVRRASVYEYLLYSYVPAPFSIYEDYLKLPPGHCFDFDEAGDTLSVRQWWAVPRPSEPAGVDFPGAVASLRTVFGQAVERRMISDVPIGAFLSGGIDSSVIVAEMAARGGAIRTFSIGYRDNPEYDESPYANLVADALGVKHTVLYPDLNGSDISQYVDLITRQFDEPFGNPTVALTHLLTASVREHVTVALAGDGGDELFAGYPRHNALMWAGRLRGWLGPLSTAVVAFLRTLPETPAGNHRVRRLRRFFTSLRKPLGAAFQDWSSVFPIDAVMATLVPPGQTLPEDARTAFISDWFEASGGDAVASAQYADLNSFLPYNLMEGADRMSMANGFELRVPFVARAMIEEAARIPTRWKIARGEQKHILKEAYRDVLPQSIITRRKRGFNPPVWHWLQKNRPLLDSMFCDNAALYEYVSQAAVRRMTDEFFAHRADHSLQLWTLLVLEHWLKTCRV
ncbi:MAG: asnB-5 [Betaproteobacteria bacterium]|nr:asnB-5 [Betaproteobacteria bacterium]